MLTDSAIIRRDQMLLPGFRVDPPEDWRALLRTRAHVLVTGPRSALTAFARSARSELRAGEFSATSRSGSEPASSRPGLKRTTAGSTEPAWSSS